ncbi:MAG: 50S ribosomal protein L5 [Patescibacteria group bacterium]
MRLITQYTTTLRDELGKSLSIHNRHAVPALTKIVVNIGAGSRRQQSKFLDIASEDLARLTGQKPVKRVARKAIAGFKLRAGETVGLSVTLRGKRMYDFFERLVHVVLPRIRDFRGLSLTGFDGNGNYAFGVREHTIFPEIDHERVSEFYGIGIVLATSARTNDQAEALLRALGLPLKQRSVAVE